MCLLTVFPMPDLIDGDTIKRLENGGDVNPHGSGWAVIQGNRVVIGKDLDTYEAVESFIDAYSQATGPAIFHSRWATHGSKNVENVHPFPVGTFHDTYLAHNGVMPQESWPTGKDDRSDTRVFADDVLPSSYRRLDSFKVRTRLETWLAGNKVAILTTDPSLRRNLYLFGARRGEWVGGVWYSNSDYEGLTAWQQYFRESEDSAKCVMCDAKAVSEYGYCQVCGSCNDCLEQVDDCLCLISGEKDDVEVEDPPAVLGSRGEVVRYNDGWVVG